MLSLYSNSFTTTSFKRTMALSIFLFFTIFLWRHLLRRGHKHSHLYCSRLFWSVAKRGGGGIQQYCFCVIPVYGSFVTCPINETSKYRERRQAQLDSYCCSDNSKAKKTKRLVLEAILWIMSKCRVLRVYANNLFASIFYLQNRYLSYYWYRIELSR